MSRVEQGMGRRPRGRSIAIVLLIILTELAALAAAQRSAIIGAALLLPLAGMQIVLAARLRGRAGKILLVASSVSLAAAGTSAAAVYLRKDTHEEANRPFLVRGGPLGWGLNPGKTHIRRSINGQTIFDQTVTVDKDGHRKTISANSGAAIAFLGDSFTFGDGVADSETMPQAFADLTQRRFRVMNLGVAGYSPAQVLRTFELDFYADALRPTKALFILTLNWHAARVACAHYSLVGAPHYASEDGVVHLAGTCPPEPPPSWFTRIVRATPLGSIIADGLRHASDAEIQTYIDVLAAADRVARTKYAVPLRVLYLRNASYLVLNWFSDDKIIAALRQRGVLVYDLTLPQERQEKFAIPRDGHPTALAHRLHAEKLIDALKRTEPDLLGASAEASH